MNGSIAVVFPRTVRASWVDAIEQCRAVQNAKLSVCGCSDLSELERARPMIIVGHESDSLVRYISSDPPNLEWVHFMSAGLDRTLKELGRRSRPYKVTNVRGIHAAAMREYVWTAILHFEKQVPQLLAQQRRKEWLRPSLGLLRGKRILVVGVGAIGRAVAASAKAFGLTVVGVARSSRTEHDFERVVALSALEEELPDADYVVLCVPLTEETEGLLGQRQVLAMKEGAILVNVSRGELVDDSALIPALKSRALRGAVLDAFREEPLPGDSPLWEIANVLITPHIAGKFEGGRRLGTQVFEDNLSAFMNKEPLVTEVCLRRGY